MFNDVVMTVPLILEVLLIVVVGVVKVLITVDNDHCRSGSSSMFRLYFAFLPYFVQLGVSCKTLSAGNTFFACLMCTTLSGPPSVGITSN